MTIIIVIVMIPSITHDAVVIVVVAANVIVVVENGAITASGGAAWAADILAWRGGHRPIHDVMVGAAEETVVSDSELVPSYQGFVAHHTPETVEVVHCALGGAHHHVLATESNSTPGTLGAEQSGETEHTGNGRSIS